MVYFSQIEQLWEIFSWQKIMKSWKKFKNTNYLRKKNQFHICFKLIDRLSVEEESRPIRKIKKNHDDFLRQCFPCYFHWSFFHITCVLTGASPLNLRNNTNPTLSEWSANLSISIFVLSWLHIFRHFRYEWIFYSFLSKIDCIVNETCVKKNELKNVESWLIHSFGAQL